MREQVIQIAEILGYILLAWLFMRMLRGAAREISFTAVNLAGLYLFFFSGRGTLSAKIFLAYLALASVQYLTLRLFAKRKGRLPSIAFFTPLAALVFIRYVPALWPQITSGYSSFGPLFVGISYLAFRCSLLALEVRNGVVPMPGICRYLGFCFFAPTMLVGPINPYSNYRRGFEGEQMSLPIGRSWMRILIGLVKYKFLGSIFYQLSYSNLLFDDHYHLWIDLFVAVIFYYLYLYCNFSGFCDLAIGAAGLIGIPVAENFNDPFVARNVKDFWNRWHITLSQYMRDVVFTPLSKFLVGLTGPRFVDHAVAISIFVVFLLVGVWHGVGWNFAAFGLIHSVGLVANHYYTIWLKKRLGREGLKAYMANRWIHAVAVVVTFTYCAAALFVFANTFPEIKKIISVMR